MIKIINYKKFLDIQKVVSIEHIEQIKFDYRDLKVTVSCMLIKEAEALTLEEFICTVWKKDFYECDKSYYSKFNNSKDNAEMGLITPDDVSQKNDYLISIESKDIKYILNKFIDKDDMKKLKIEFESINSCYVLSSNKSYIIDDCIDSVEGLSVIFYDNKKIYMVEFCVDC